MNPIDAFKTANGDVLDIWTAFRKAALVWHDIKLAPSPDLEQEWLERVEVWSGRPADDALRELVRLAAAMSTSLPDSHPFLVQPTLRRVDSGRGVALFAHRDGEGDGLFFGIATPLTAKSEDVAIYSFDYDLDPDEIDPDEADNAAAACEREINAARPEAFALNVLLGTCAPEGALHLIGCCDEDEADTLEEEARHCLGSPIELMDTRLYGAADLLVKTGYSYPLGHAVEIMARNRAACSPLSDAFMRQIGLSVLAFEKHDWKEG